MSKKQEQKPDAELRVVPLDTPLEKIPPGFSYGWIVQHEVRVGRLAPDIIHAVIMAGAFKEQREEKKVSFDTPYVDTQDPKWDAAFPEWVAGLPEGFDPEHIEGIFATTTIEALPKEVHESLQYSQPTTDSVTLFGIPRRVVARVYFQLEDLGEIRKKIVTALNRMFY